MTHGVELNLLACIIGGWIAFKVFGSRKECVIALIIELVAFDFVNSQLHDHADPDVLWRALACFLFGWLAGTVVRLCRLSANKDTRPAK